jgi:type II secretory pathway component PulF
VSDVFQRYPNLYPKHVVGSIRVGEQAGYFAEGCTIAAESVERARRLAGRLAYFPVIALFMLVIYPLSMGAIRGSLESMKQQDKAGGSMPVMPTILNAIGVQMKTYGPIALACLIGAFVLWKVWKMPAFRRARHTAGLDLFPGRSRSEAVVRLGWGIGRSAQAGIPYYAAYQLAVDCIPNEILRDRVAREAATTREGEPLSGALRRSNILPPQYADVVETGEMTGDVPRAMEQLTNFAKSDFERADSVSEAKGKILGLMVIGLLTTILVVSLAVAWYGGLIQWGTSDEFLSFL